MNISTIIKNRRAELGLTMKELADRCGVSEATISRWESGDIQNMRRDKVAALSVALHVPPSLIMGWEEDPQTFSEEVQSIAPLLEDRTDLRVLVKAAASLTPDDIIKVLDFMNHV